VTVRKPDEAPPHDFEAEQAVLGAMTISTQALAHGCQTLLAEDFYRPAHGQIFAALVALYGAGQPTDHVSLEAQLARSGVPIDAIGGHAVLFAIKTHTPSASSVAHYAEIVAETALRRRLISAARTFAESAADLSCDAGEVLDKAKADLAEIDAPLWREPQDMSLSEFMAEARKKPRQWLVKGLVREMWRVVIIAGEGDGKSWLLRQLAVCAAYGLHPLRNTKIEPVPSLIVDTENPADTIADCLERLLPVAQRLGCPDPVDRIYYTEGGINLRKRADRLELEAILRARRPQLVCMGPLYQLYTATAAEGWEAPAREVISVLDDWRRRFRFALILEDHAPQSQAGRREMRPYGSSLWRRWPDVALTLERKQGTDGKVLTVGSFKGHSRGATDWPDEFHMAAKGRPWPWEGHWEQGPQDQPGGSF
jgi:replicative DNA helicase